MKISNEQENLLNIITAVLFFLGIIIFLKIGFVNWIIICSILYFFIIKDEEFMKNIIPPTELSSFPVYGIMWFASILMPIVLALMYFGSRLSGYSQEDDD